MTLVSSPSRFSPARLLWVISAACLITLGISTLPLSSQTVSAQTSGLPADTGSDVAEAGNADAADSTEEAVGEDANESETTDETTDTDQAEETDGAAQTADQSLIWYLSNAVYSWISAFFQTPPLGYLVQGGVFMWPILIMGIIGAGVIIERYRSLNMLAGDPKQLRSEVQTLLESNRVREAFELCNQQQGPVPAILATGLRKHLVLQTLDYEPAKIEEQVVKSMDDYSVHIVAALERHLPILATISSAAPMLGFLGTVQGMIVAFDDIVAKMGEMNIVEAAAEGIKVSLMTTCFGLIVGIPAFVAFNYFTGIINRFVLDVEESATEMIESVTLQTAITAADSDPVGSQSP
jgi:biopolymer transport protein ExbB